MDGVLNTLPTLAKVKLDRPGHYEIVRGVAHKNWAGISPAELLDDIGLLNERLVAAHCLFLDEGDFERVGNARINVARIPKGNATGGTAAPTSRLRRAGARIALATDNMHADMVEVMRWGLNIGRLRSGFRLRNVDNTD